MAFFPLELPPGVYRNGTQYQSKGHFFDANLIRWIDRAIKPIGGWRKRSTDAVAGAARAVIAWRDNNALTWLGIGTHSKLFASNRAGDIFDITPTGLATVRAEASTGGGYGSGAYGVGSYGTPRADSTLIQDATVWSLDTWGQDLIGVSDSDGVIYEWALNTSTPAAAVYGAPTCDALFVTGERIVMALGAAGDPRLIKWCDQEDNTDWTPTATNQAGSFPLQTGGKLMCGKLISSGALIFTDVDVWLASYTADQLVYSFNKLGSGCGAVSRQCVAALDSQAVWMGKDAFWLHNGYVQPLPCDVADYVFSDFNRQQVSKTYAVRNSGFNEVEWHYCSSSSTEIDRCVVWNYRENYWNIGRPGRTCGTDKGVFTYPIMLDRDGNIYEHEVGLNYDGALPYAEGGPIEIGNGDNVMYANMLIPDERTTGQVTATFQSRIMPNLPETTFGPYLLSSPTPVRVNGRQVSVRYDAVAAADWRVGSPRLDVLQGGTR